MGWSESPTFSEGGMMVVGSRGGNAGTPPNISEALLSSEARRHSSLLRASLGHQAYLSSDDETLMRIPRHDDSNQSSIPAPLSSPASSLISQQESSV